MNAAGWLDHIGLVFSTTWPFLLLTLIPVLWWVQRRTKTDLSPRQLLLSWLVRSTIVVLLSVALTRPAVLFSGTWTSVVYLLDVSRSVPSEAVEAGIDWIKKVNEFGTPDHFRIVPFGANSRVLSQQEEVSGDRAREGINQEATNLEAALNRALQVFSPNHLRRLVLISDGNDNGGDITSTLVRFARQGIPIFTRSVSERISGDCWIEAFHAPPEILADSLFTFDVQVMCQSRQMGIVTLEYGGNEIGRKESRFEKGLNRISFEISIGKPGHELIEAGLQVPLDTFSGNDRLSKDLPILARPKVLYVEGAIASLHYLRDVLKEESIDVQTLPARELPSSAGGLRKFDLILISDLPRKDLSDLQMRALKEYVEEFGGGFILVGGEGIYGQDGYEGTPLEEILPVTFDARKRREDLPVALVLVLDKSGSMRGQKMDLAKEASKAAVRVLRENDRIGVVAFDYESYWPVPLQAAANRAEIDLEISTIEAAGETNIYPALESAHVELQNAEALVKHVILLSDGRSLPEDYQQLVSRMTASKITVSTVAVGGGADRDLLANIARWGRGRAYYLEDAKQVPQIFTEETRKAANPTLVERSIQPHARGHSAVLEGIDFASAPPLLGYVRVQAKETAETLLETEQKDPLLVRWQDGLGRTAIFASDLKNRWAKQWLDWAGYGKFVSQLVQETMTPEFEDAFELKIVPAGKRVRLIINALDETGRFRNLLELQVRHSLEEEMIEIVGSRQVGPGRYETDLSIDRPGAHLFQVVDEGRIVASKLFIDSYPEEYHFFPPKNERLRAISQQTGGQFNPQPKELFESRGERVQRLSPIWQYLTVASLLLYLVDIALRRSVILSNFKNFKMLELTRRTKRD